MDDQINDPGKEAKFKEFFERARKGVLKHLAAKGGALPMGDLHDYSLKTYLIQHQRFSQMMESFAEDKFIDYDAATQMTTLTDEGRKFIN